METRLKICIMTYTTSWQFKALTYFAILLIAISCKKKNNDPIALQSDEMVGAFFMDSLTPQAGSIRVDSNISSDRLVSRHLVGVLQSQKFGEQAVASYTQIKIPFSDFAFPPGAVYKSAALHLYPNYFYGDDERSVDILLYELKEDLFSKGNDSYRDYYNFETTEIGAFIDQFSFDPKNDSLIVSISDVLGAKIFNAGEVEFDNQESFNTYFKGISFQPLDGGDGVVGFDNERSFIRIYYDDEYEDLYFNTDVTNYNTIQADRSGTVLSTLKDNEVVSSDDLGNTFYVQAGARIDGYLTFNNADDMLYNTKRGIYKAELEIVNDNWEYDIIQTVRTWELVVEMKTTEPEYTYTFTERNPNSTKFTYDITPYAQQVAAGEHHFEGARFRIAHLSSLGSRIVCGNGVDGFTVTNPSEKVKLKIYFTEF